MSKSVFFRGPLRNGWRAAPCAVDPPGPVHMTKRWMYRSQPPRLEHVETGYRVALYTRGLLAGGALALAALRLPELDVTELKDLVERWLDKHATQADRDQAQEREDLDLEEELAAE